MEFWFIGSQAQWQLMIFCEIWINQYNPIHNRFDPEITYHNLQHELENDPENPKILKSLTYLALRFHHSEQASEYSKKYISLEGGLADSSNYRFILETVQHVSDTNFQIMLNNSTKFENRFGKEIFYSKMQIIVCMEEILPKISSNGTKEQWDSIGTDLKRKYAPILVDAAIAQAQLYYYSFKKDWSSFSIAIDKYAGCSWSLPGKLNDFAFAVFQKCPDTSIMRHAVNWCITAFEKEANPSFLATHAQLLYQSGHKEEAIEILNNAIELANKMNMDKGWEYS